jgi:polysaccharide export outer membrane protein
MTFGQLGRAFTLLGGLIPVLLTGCSTQSAQGPTSFEIAHNSGRDTDFVLIDLSPAVLQQFAEFKRPSLLESFGNATPAPIRTLEKGDIVSVTIWDAGGGLFSPQGSVPAQSGTTLGTQQTNIPNQTVDPDGRITVPFAGQIRVAGKSVVEAQRAIMGALAQKALQPQVLVNLVTDQSNSVTVIGDVKTPNRLPLDINGTRILDAIARAGGSVAPAFNEIVQLTRRGVAKRVRLSWIHDNPVENIYLQPDDTVYVLHDPEAVAVLGAATKNMRLEFDTEKMTLADAVGLAEGLRDNQAEPSGVFIFRMEPSELVHGMKADAAAANGGMVPVVFRTDLRAPQDFFLAQTFQMRDKDIVYVANAETTQFDKLIVKLLHIAAIANLVAHDSSIGVNANLDGVALPRLDGGRS